MEHPPRLIEIMQNKIIAQYDLPLLNTGIIISPISLV